LFSSCDSLQNNLGKVGEHFYYGKSSCPIYIYKHIMWCFSFILMRFLLITFRAGDLVVPNLGAEAISDVTSSSGPVKMEDLQRILSNIGARGMFSESTFVHISVCCP